MKSIRLQLMIVLACIMFQGNVINAQDQWEAQKRFTGYISTEFDYFNKLTGYQDNYNVNLAEAGLLASYKPTQDITFKMVFVYRPEFSIDEMLNEANVQYDFSEKVGIKVGRFLTPLSPMNTYYYAPVNTSSTLPVLVSNHEFFPLNMDAISINGSLGENLSLSYNLFAGGYHNTTWMTTGAVGFFGDEVAYYKELINSTYTVDDSYGETHNLALGGNVRLAYQDYIKIGMSVFKPKKEDIPVYLPALDVTQHLKAEKITYGFDFNFSLNNTKLIGEIWNSDLNVDGKDVDLKGSFIQLSQSINRFTPFVRYEDQTTNDIEFQRYTGGVMFKPSFESTLKMEYLHYNHEVQNIDGLVISLIYSF